MVKEFFVHCGNWCLRVNKDVKSFDTKNDCYIEMATQAIEIIFGDKEFQHPDDDFYAVVNEDGINVMEHEVDSYPEPTFTTKIHILSSKNNDPHKLLTSLRTADIFSNAAQHTNYKLALKAEQLENK